MNEELPVGLIPVVGTLGPCLTSPMPLRKTALVSLCLGAFLLLPGCGGNPARPEGDDLRRRADEAFLKGDFSQAAHHYERLATASPALRAWALVHAGLSRNGAADWDRAARSFGDALAASPAADLRLQALYYRSIAHAAKLRFREALEDLAAVEAAGAAARGAALAEDEFLYRIGVTRLRSGDWNAGRRDLERLVAGFPDSRWTDEASDRIALRATCIQIGRAGDAEDAKRIADEARAKGVVTETLKGPRDFLVVAGKFRTAADAQADLARIRAVYPDAFLIP